MQSREDIPVAAFGTLLLHGLALLVMLVSGWLPTSRDLLAPGPPVEATIQFTAADLEAAREFAKAAPEPPPPPAPPQPKPQAPLERPDDIDQEEIVEVGPLPSEEAEVQPEKSTQAQVDLTEDIERQREAENRERLRAEYEAIKREREEATRLTRMEEQRLAQLADRPSAMPRPAAPNPSPPSGARGVDEGLLARYLAAMNATARDNWNTGLAPEGVRCVVRFRQLPGGDVMEDNVEFIACPYDAQGRESVLRALKKTPMPYSGFESVFNPIITLNFCHPEEACQ
jgi:colicin import membrane protein